MFCSCRLNNKINRIHERALRIVYQDYESSFDDLLAKDKSLRFHHRNIHQVAIEMFKLDHVPEPVTVGKLRPVSRVESQFPQWWGN